MDAVPAICDSAQSSRISVTESDQTWGSEAISRGSELMQIVKAPKTVIFTGPGLWGIAHLNLISGQ